MAQLAAVRNASSNGVSALQAPLIEWDDDADWSLWFADDEDEDWKETPDGWVVQAHVPGLKKEDIRVEVKNYRVLTISGGFTRQGKYTPNNGDPTRIAQTAIFVRQVPLPDDSKTKQMMAKLENGVLLVKVPKSEKPKPSSRLLAITN